MLNTISEIHILQNTDNYDDNDDDTQGDPHIFPKFLCGQRIDLSDSVLLNNARVGRGHSMTIKGLNDSEGCTDTHIIR